MRVHTYTCVTCAHVNAFVWKRLFWCSCWTCHWFVPYICINAGVCTCSETIYVVMQGPWGCSTRSFCVHANQTYDRVRIGLCGAYIRTCVIGRSPIGHTKIFPSRTATPMINLVVAYGKSWYSNVKIKIRCCKCSIIYANYLWCNDKYNIKHFNMCMPT